VPRCSFLLVIVNVRMHDENRGQNVRVVQMLRLFIITVTISRVSFSSYVTTVHRLL
jgi:hypothetical protein